MVGLKVVFSQRIQARAKPQHKSEKSIRFQASESLVCPACHLYRTTSFTIDSVLVMLNGVAGWGVRSEPARLFGNHVDRTEHGWPTGLTLP
jgi:hypothetical protein